MESPLALMRTGGIIPAIVPMLPVVLEVRKRLEAEMLGCRG
jgi:hypothetical protein